MIATVATSFALGIVGGSEGRHLLDSGHTIEVADKKEHSVEIDAKETDGIIHISNAKHVFVNGLHVSEDQLEVVKNMNKNLEINTRREVNSLQEKPEQLSTYIKTILADEYNQANGANITSDDITIHREKAKEKNENSNSSAYERILDEGINLIKVTVKKEDNEKDNIALAYIKNSRRDYKKAPIYFPKDYEKGQEILEKLLPLIDNGLDWIDQRAEDGGAKQSFFESILKHKISKMNEITTECIKLDNDKKESADQITEEER